MDSEKTLKIIKINREINMKKFASINASPIVCIFLYFHKKICWYEL